MSDAVDFGAQSAGQQLAGEPSEVLWDGKTTNPDQSNSVAIQEDEYMMAERSYPGLGNSAQIINRNKAAHTLVSRSFLTPNMDRSFNELQDQATAAQYASALTGISNYYASRNLNQIIQDLYPEMPPSNAKFVENMRAVSRQADLMRDLHFLQNQQRLGDSSLFVQQEITARQRQLMNMGDLQKIIPAGFGSGAEDAAYSAARQWEMYKDVIPRALWGTVKGAAIAAAMAIGGHLLGVGFAVGGGGLAGRGATQTLMKTTGVPIKTAMGIGTKPFRMKETFDYYQQQNAGANWAGMIERLQEDDINFNEKSVAQAAGIIGAITAGIQLVELEGFNRLFTGNKLLSSSFYDISGSDKFMGVFAAGLRKRLVGTPGVMAQETASELAEELVETFLTEMYLRRQGAEPIDISMEEVMDQILFITKDTLTNTAIFGLGFGTAGALADAGASTGKRIINNETRPMSRKGRQLLSDLPTGKGMDIRLVEGAEGVNLTNVDDESIRINGQKIYEAAKVEPKMPAYMSPAQRAILNEYVKRESHNVALSDALSAITGHTLSELEGMTSLEFESAITDIESQSRFHQRLTSAGENVTTDGTPIEFALEDGTPAEISVTQKENIAIIDVVRKGETTLRGQIVAKINPSGSLSIKTIDSSEFDSPGDIQGIVNMAIPNSILFDDETTLSAQEQMVMKDMDKIRKKGYENLSVSEVERGIELVAELELTTEPTEDSPEGRKYRRRVPVVHEVDVDYWEDVEIDEDIPVDDKIVLAEEGQQVQEALDQEVDETLDKPTEDQVRKEDPYGLTRAKRLMARIEIQFDKMYQDNADAVALGESPPHNLEGTQRKIDQFEATINELIAAEQDRQEIYDLGDYNGVAPVEEDVAFTEDVAKSLMEIDKVRNKLDAKNMDPMVVDTYFTEAVQELIDLTEVRLEQRRWENQKAIRNGLELPYNVSTLISVRNNLYGAMGVELYETPSDRVRFLQEIQGSEMQQLAMVQESLNSVYNKYNKDQAFKDLRGFARKAAIIEAHREELNIETSRRFKDRKITSQNLVELAQDRMQLNDSIQEMNDTGVAREARMLSPEERAQGVMHPMDAYDYENRVETVPLREETERETVKRRQTRSVRKTRTEKQLVMEDQYFNRDANPTDTMRKFLLNNASDSHLEFSKAFLHQAQSQIAAIRNIYDSVATANAKAKLDSLFGKAGVNPMIRDQSSTIGSGTMIGATDMERQRFAESMQKSLDKMPLNDLTELYKEVIGIGRLDIRLGGYQVGQYSMGPSAVANIIARESSTQAMYGRRGEKVRGNINQIFFRMYDPTLNYSTLIEKVRGRDSLSYKVLFSDINDQYLARERFNYFFLNEYGARFNELPGVKSPKAYWSEVVGEFGDYELTKDRLIALLQHRRSEYNWDVMKRNGISVETPDGYKPLSNKMATGMILFAENYELTAADQAALDIYQNGMDRLYELANAYSMQINGVPLEKDEFYIRLRPEFMTEEGKQQFTDEENKIRLWSDISAIKERIGNDKPVRLVGAGYEFDRSTNNVTSQYFMARVFSRAESVMNNTAVKNSMDSRFHKEFWNLVKDGLERWRGRSFQEDLISRAFDTARQNFVAASLGANLEVAVLQTFSLPLYATMVDPKYLGKAMIEANMHPKRTDALLKTWSTQYLIRGNAGQIDIKEGRDRDNDRGAFGRALKTVKNVAFEPIHIADKFTVRMGSLAAMTQVLTEIDQGHFSDSVKSALDVDDADIENLTTPEMKRQLAGRFADFVMERTQPMAQEQHLSNFQRKNVMTRTLTMFSGFTNMMNNLYYRMHIDWQRGTPGAGKAYATTLITGALLLPAMTGFFNVMRGRLHDRISGKDRDELDPMLGAFLSQYFNSVAGSWFVVRDAERAVNNHIMKGYNKNNLVDIPIYEVTKLYIDAVMQFFEAINPNNNEDTREKNAENAKRNIGRAVAYSFGLPFTPMRLYSEVKERKEN